MPSQDTDKPLELSEDSALRKILEGTAGVTGSEFFRALVKNLAEVLGVYGAFLTEYYPDKSSARTLAFWTADGWIEDYLYEVHGTPCEIVFRSENFLHIEDRVSEMFPTDLDFKEMNIASYMGEPIFGIDDRVIGHLSVVDKKPLPDESRCMALFKIFAARAAAERKRLDAENAIREREENLARLLEGTMDAIVELDEKLRIVQFNGAAADLFGCKAEHIVGADFADLIAPDAAAAFSALARELSGGKPGRRSAWIREGFRGRRGDGSFFPAEASLTCTLTGKHSYFTIVLRNVEDRIRTAARIRELSRESEQLRAEINTLRGHAEVIGQSPALLAVLQAIERVATVDTTILLTGETGTGKEVIARAIHAASARSDKPLVRVNCAAVPANLIESEFFGHEKGAFTGATSQRAGRFALADGGTIFLDEIGELPLELQSKLLRVLQEGEFEPVGSSTTHSVDVRVVAATNRDLEEEVGERRFREDLYYRLNVYPIYIPPLRERDDDVVLLAEFFGGRLAAEMGRPFPGLTDQCRDLLRSHAWPGNVRELQNVVERALLSAAIGGPLNLAAALPNRETVTTSMPLDLCAGDQEERILTDADLRRLERENMIRALEACDWKISGSDGASARLGLKPSTMTSRMKALGIEKSQA